ncbi:GNAT family N-acetyltransferase [Streptosporangium sp. NPDC051023]|uniref:GNAT family N-acetyltransferase n=1 Tax=Streptosporangium sp. NPDC051023 TaxID=3155410 RepID=UPI00344EE897
MSSDALLATYDEQVRGIWPTPLPGVTHERDGSLLRIVSRLRGVVIAPRDVGVRGAELDRLIARQRDRFAERGQDVEWKTWGHDEPADLVDRLRDAGFVPEAQETVLIGLAEELAGEPVLPDGVVLREVTAHDDLRAIAAMESAIWDEDLSWIGEHLIEQVTHTPDEITILAADAGGVTVSAAWLAYRAGTEFAGMWGGSTLREWRGRGIYRALVTQRARRAVARGVRYLHVDASDDSAPILHRLGFQAVTTTTPYVWTPPRP